MPDETIFTKAFTLVAGVMRGEWSRAILADMAGAYHGMVLDAIHDGDARTLRAARAERLVVETAIMWVDHGEEQAREFAAA